VFVEWYIIPMAIQAMEVKLRLPARLYERVAQAAQGNKGEVAEVIVAALEAALPPLSDSLPPDVAAEVVRWAWLEDEALRAVAAAFLPRQQQRRFTTLARKEETGRLTARERAAWEQLRQVYLRLSQNKAMAQFILTQRARDDHQARPTPAGACAHDR
jgi:hypothetical protein